MTQGVIEQAAQLMLDHGARRKPSTYLKDRNGAAPSGRLSDLLGDAYTQLHDFANAELAYQQSGRAGTGRTQPSPRTGANARCRRKIQGSAGAISASGGRWIRTIRIIICIIAEMDRQLHQLDEAEKRHRAGQAARAGQFGSGLQRSDDLRSAGPL